MLLKLPVTMLKDKHWVCKCVGLHRFCFPVLVSLQSLSGTSHSLNNILHFLVIPALNDTLYFSVTPAFTQWHLVPFSNTYIHSVTLCTFQRHLHSPIDTFNISVMPAFSDSLCDILHFSVTPFIRSLTSTLFSDILHLFSDILHFSVTPHWVSDNLHFPVMSAFSH